MLAVHWTPVSNTKSVLKNGITKSKNGLYCFPLTGIRSLDRWWIHFFNQKYSTRKRKKYNGIIFRIKQEDLPAYFGSWPGATTRHDFEKEITSIKALGTEYRETLLWRLGELLARNLNLNTSIWGHEKETEIFLKLADLEIQKSPKAFVQKTADINFMTYALEDYQIVLTKSIAANRILKVLPQGDEFGRVHRLRKKLRY